MSLLCCRLPRQVLEMLDDDSEARQQQLAARFEDVMSTVEDALLC